MGQFGLRRVKSITDDPGMFFYQNSLLSVLPKIFSSINIMFNPITSCALCVCLNVYDLLDGILLDGSG